LVRKPDSKTEKQALAYLLGRFSGRRNVLETTWCRNRFGSTYQPEHSILSQGKGDG
jgi:hypothetical protein